MESDDKKSLLAKQIENEVLDYVTKEIDLSDGTKYSQYKLTRRISMFESKTYPKGKFDKQGNYKYWFDIISPCVDDEVKNIDFDTKNVEAWSPADVDEVPSLIVNLKLDEYLRKTGQAEEFNSAFEEGAGWGNIVWKKVGNGYERSDLRNLYVINQTAFSLKDTPVIERHQYSQTKVKKMMKGGSYKNLDYVIRECGSNFYKAKESDTEEETTTPYYLFFERNGEVSLAALKQYRGEQILPGDSDVFVLAKVIAAGIESNGGAIKIKQVIYAEQISKMPFKEFHRSRYKGKWFREGLYEILFDLQVRANQVGNELALGLSWSAKTVFTSAEKTAIQNILTDLRNGDIIRSQSLRQLEVRMQGADQLFAEWNRIIAQARQLAHSTEIVQGGDLPSNTPFRLGALLNTNANKIYIFIRQKLGIPLSELFEEWIIPELIKELTAESVIRLTGESVMLDRMYELVVEDWYLRNLVAIGPHTPEIAATLKADRIEELKKRPLLMDDFHDAFEGYKARASVIITGENVDLPELLVTLSTFIQLESDPVRRTYLIEKAMRFKGFDVSKLPKSTPEQLSGVQPGQKPQPVAA